MRRLFYFMNKEKVLLISIDGMRPDELPSQPFIWGANFQKASGLTAAVF